MGRKDDFGSSSVKQLQDGGDDFGPRDEDTWDSRKVMKNLIVVSFAFFLLFTAFLVSFKVIIV